jgi:hypothetical protein
MKPSCPSNRDRAKSGRPKPSVEGRLCYPTPRHPIGQFHDRYEVCISKYFLPSQTPNSPPPFLSAAVVHARNTVAGGEYDEIEKSDDNANHRRRRWQESRRMYNKIKSMRFCLTSSTRDRQRNEVGCDWLHVKSWQILATARQDMYIDIRSRTGDPCIDFVHKVHIHAPPMLL